MSRAKKVFDYPKEVLSCQVDVLGDMAVPEAVMEDTVASEDVAADLATAVTLVAVPHFTAEAADVVAAVAMAAEATSALTFLVQSTVVFLAVCFLHYL